MVTVDRTHWRERIGEHDKAIYARAGFGASSELGERPAVLVIDVQYRTVGHRRVPIEEAMQEYPTACGQAGWSAVDHIVPLLAAAREKSVPVIYPHVAPKASYDAGRVAEKVPTIMEIDAPGYAFVEEVAPGPDDILVPKRHPSAFFGTSLASYLFDQRIDTLIVCGCTTSGCIRATVTDGFSYNLRIAVPEECVYDRSELSHAVNLFDMDSKYAQVVPRDRMLEYVAAL